MASLQPAQSPAIAKSGILPSHAIRMLVESGAIRLEKPLIEGQVQPASLDLRLGARAIRVRASFLPGKSMRVSDKLEQLALHEIDISSGAVLETGCVYIVPLLESLALDATIAAAANPKSSTGRLDVFTRVIADHAQEFDQIDAGYTGPLYAEISPRTFPVLVREQSRLTQIRFRSGHAVCSDRELCALNESEGLVTAAKANIDGGLALSVDLVGEAESGLIGFRAKRHTALIDLDKVAAYEVLDFWEPIFSRGENSLILDPDQFYILASKEAVQVPPGYAAEMIPFNPLVGEFRVHYAGFFDPGFGYSGAGGAGSRAVLEVRSHEVPFILEDGQIVGRLLYERLTEMPKEVYGSDIGSSYQRQGLKLSKHFKPLAAI